MEVFYCTFSHENLLDGSFTTNLSESAIAYQRFHFEIVGLVNTNDIVIYAEDNCVKHELP